MTDTKAQVDKTAASFTGLFMAAYVADVEPAWPRGCIRAQYGTPRSLSPFLAMADWEYIELRHIQFCVYVPSMS